MRCTSREMVDLCTPRCVAISDCTPGFQPHCAKRSTTCRRRIVAENCFSALCRARPRFRLHTVSQSVGALHHDLLRTLVLPVVRPSRARALYSRQLPAHEGLGAEEMPENSDVVFSAYVGAQFSVGFLRFSALFCGQLAERFGTFRSTRAQA